ncbi:hypothetical protein QTG54_006354 [Skeletonema marinoi]|uniref:DUF6824 domain-containing protein n=1 Tax=Skeletonema marinoi TaxID=267567 RepID=A0AAD8YAW1_9STRA|nr:hypothetical protein QTG54_006354 [Skeletonema marinoi]
MTSYIPISLNDALNGRGMSIFDVLNGQGNHLKQTAGNVNYRRLVSANKDLYMKCQERDKIKISMGIVAAVRKNDGRFLAYDGSKKIFYADIGDNGARVKTSQALRDAKSVPPIGIPTPHVDRSKELPQELYSNHSCRILASFLSNIILIPSQQ